MKKISVYMGISILLSLSVNPTQAQFLKRILNTVKNTADNRANDQAAKSTNKAIDKTLDGSKSGTKNSSSNNGDSASTNRVLGAFAKAANDNPNDTSMSDLLGKSLGNLTGGGGVSASDSVEAIRSYKSGIGGNGVYYEYSIESSTKERGTAKSTSKIYLTYSGEGRSEMNMAAMMGVQNGTSLVVIGRMNKPHFSVIIDDEKREYSLNVIDTALINSNLENYKVTKLGSETVNGYNCTHARLISTTGSGIFKYSSTEDIWTSESVPGYDLLKKATMQQNVTPAMMKALNDAGCGGFFVKMVSGDKHYSITMQLAKAEKNSFPSSLFKIPAGYTESKNNLMIGNMMQAAPKK